MKEQTNLNLGGLIMYEEHLGKEYHEKIRKMLTVDDVLLPDKIIDAEANIGGMKMLITPALERINMFGNGIHSEARFNQLSNAAIYYLCGILCMAMKSRTSTPPYNLKKYQKNWDKKQKGYMEKGNMLMRGLIGYVN